MGGKIVCGTVWLGVVSTSYLFSCCKTKSSLVDDPLGEGFMMIEFLLEDPLLADKGSSEKPLPVLLFFKCYSPK